MAAKSYLDRGRSLEPFYQLTEIKSDSPWVRHGARRTDGAPVVIRVLAGLGQERLRQRVENYLSPLIRAGEVIEVLAQNGDLFAVWRRLGDLSLEDLRRVGTDDPRAGRARELADQTLRQWHQAGVHHGPFQASGIRYDDAVERCWLVAPALARVAQGLPLPSRPVDRRVLAFELDRWLPADPDPLHAAPAASRQRRFAPPGRARELGALLDWRLAPSRSTAAVLGEPGIGKSTLVRCFADALAEEGVAAVLARPVDAPDLRWLGAILDRLANEVLALPPLVSRRAVGHTREAVGLLRPVAARLSPRWAELWNLASPDAGEPPTAPPEGIERLRLQAAASLIAGCDAHLPLVLIIDDADRAQREVAAFMQALRSAPAEPVKVLTTSSARLPFAVATQLELGPLRGDDLTALVADVLKVADNRAAPLAKALDGALSGVPCDVRAALDAAVARGWLAPDSLDLDADQLAQLAHEQRAPEVVVELLRRHAERWPVLEMCALLPRPLTLPELEARTEVGLDGVLEALALARREGALEERGGHFGLRWSIAEAIAATLSDERRRELHRRAADRLAASGAPAVDVAPHLVRGWGDGVGTEAERETLVVAGRGLLAGYSLLAGRPIVERLRALVERAAFESPDLEAEARLVVANWAFLQSDFDDLETALEVPAGAADLHKAPLLGKSVLLHALHGDYDAACDTGFAALSELGIEPRGGAERLQSLVDRVIDSWADLDALEPASDEARVRQELLGALLPAAFVARPDRFDAVVCELAERTLDEGLTADSVRGLTTLAQLTCVELGDSDLGARLGRVGLALAQRVPGHRYLPVVYSDLANFVMPWSGYLEESYELNRKGRNAAEATGETQYGGYIRMHDAFNRLTLGDRLGPLVRRVDRYRRSCLHNRMALESIDSVRDALQAMTSPTPPTTLVEAPANSAAMVQCIHQLGRALAAMVHRSDDLLRQHLDRVEPVLESTRGWVFPTILYLYLRGVDAYRHDDFDGLRLVRIRLQPYERKIDPVSPLAQHLRALELAASGNVHDALAMFQRAITTAMSLDFPPMPGFAAEDASLLAGSSGLADVSATFERRAARNYAEWGLEWKANSLGHGQRQASPQRALAEMLTPDTDPGDIAAGVLGDLAEQVRERSGAERCELLIYRRTELMRVLASEAGAPPTSDEPDSIDERHLGHAAINTRQRQVGDDELALPLFHGANALVVHLCGAAIDEKAAGAAIDELATALMLWMDVWSVQLDNLDIQRVALSLIDALGSHGFLVGFDGRGRTLSGTEFRVPDEIASATERALGTGEVQRLELPWPPDGEQSICRLTVVPCSELATVRSDVEPVLWFAEDITESKLAERGAAAERELALFRKLASGLAHDLSNKLVMMSVLASRGSDDPAFTDAAREAFDAGRRLLARMTRLTTEGATRPVPTPIDLRRHLEGSSSLYSWVLDPSVAFHVEFPDQPVHAIAESGSVDRIVLNLIINAKQALDDGRGEIRVRLCEPAGGTVTLEVSDTGQGIPPAIAERIFDAGVSSKRSTGLGLNVVRDEADAIGARLSVQSRVGVGTTFRVEFLCDASPVELAAEA